MCVGGSFLVLLWVKGCWSVIMVPWIREAGLHQGSPLLRRYCSQKCCGGLLCAEGDGARVSLVDVGNGSLQWEIGTVRAGPR